MTAQRYLRCNKASAAAYAAFSFLMASSLFLLFTGYAAGIGQLARGVQEQFHTALLAARISNLISLAEHQNIASETVLGRRFLLYGVRPENYTMETGGGSVFLKSGGAQAEIRTNGATAVLEEQGGRRALSVWPQ